MIRPRLVIRNATIFVRGHAVFPTDVHSSTARRAQLVGIAPFCDATYDAVRKPGGQSLFVIPTTSAIASRGKASRTVRKWSDEDVLLLSNSFGDSSCDAALAARLGRSVGALRKKASRLGIGRLGPRQLELPAPPSLPAIEVRRTKAGRTVWDNSLVSFVGDLWLCGFDHHCIGRMIDSSPASVRSVANRRGMPDRGGYTLLRDYDPKAAPLPGLAERMCKVTCTQLNVVFFIHKRDAAATRFCPAYKKSKAYRDLSD